MGSGEVSAVGRVRAGPGQRRWVRPPRAAVGPAEGWKPGRWEGPHRAGDKHTRGRRGASCKVHIMAQGQLGVALSVTCDVLNSLPRKSMSCLRKDSCAGPLGPFPESLGVFPRSPLTRSARGMRRRVPRHVGWVAALVGVAPSVSQHTSTARSPGGVPRLLRQPLPGAR